MSKIHFCDIVNKAKVSPQALFLLHPYEEQEAMENFVFPDEIKTKLMKMSKLINIFLCPMKLCEIAAKLYFFLLTSVSLHNFHFNYSGLKHGTVKL